MRLLIVSSRDASHAEGCDATTNVHPREFVDLARSAHERSLSVFSQSCVFFQAVGFLVASGEIKACEVLFRWIAPNGWGTSHEIAPDGTLGDWPGNEIGDAEAEIQSMFIDAHFGRTT